MALCWSLDKIGPICRSVEDCALVLAAINGGDPADRSSIDAPFNFDAGAGIAGMRLGWLRAAFEDEGASDVDRAALEAAKRLDVDLVEVSLPDLPYGSLMDVLYAEAAAAFEELTLSDRDDELSWQEEGAWPNAFRKARFLSAVDHVQLDRLRYRVMQAVGELFEQVDALIGPFMTGRELLWRVLLGAHTSLVIAISAVALAILAEGGALLPRARHAAANAVVGADDPGLARLPGCRSLDRDRARRRRRADGPGTQHAGRRAARRARPDHGRGALSSRRARPRA
jgi:Amidase